MAMGMTYDQYWYGDPLMVRAFYKAEKLRQQKVNEQAWLNGVYVYRALDATVGNMMRNKGTTQAEYPKQPIGMEDIENEQLTQEEREEKEAVYAKAYMMNMVLAGKNWHK